MTTRVADLPTPALVADGPAVAANLARMAEVRPGAQLRPHVKAHKCTALAREQAARGHTTFCAATPRELLGLAAAGLRDDLLLANESVDARRLRALAECGARITVAVDSEATIDAAARAGIREVLIDVSVGMPRCGCDPDDAGRLAELARARGLEVRGVMGYEGHVVGIPERDTRARRTERAMQLLARAHERVGGDVVSGGGTGTYDLNRWITELQAGSYVFMDGSYGELGLPFVPALHISATVVSVSAQHAVADCGLKALGMDHGNSRVDAGEVWFHSDEHVTFAPNRQVRVGDRVLVQPAHVDPTVAYHEVIHVADGPGLDAAVVDQWPVDLRGW